MNQVQAAVNAGVVGGVTGQTAAFTSVSSAANLLLVTGSWSDSATSGAISSVPSVSDSSGNVYTVASPPFRSGTGQNWWMQYCVASSTQLLNLKVVYSQSVANAAIGFYEFSSPNGWNIPAPFLDGFHVGTSGLSVMTVLISSGAIVTVNPDDLIFGLAYFSGSTIATPIGWSLSTGLGANNSVMWKELPSQGSVTFATTQDSGANGYWSAAIWAFQSSPIITPAVTFKLITATVNPTQFPEAYQNRIPEDIYDSLESTSGFVYSPYGPSRLNT